MFRTQQGGFVAMKEDLFTVNLNNKQSELRIYVHVLNTPCVRYSDPTRTQIA